MSENCIKKTYFGERGVANIILSSNINGEFSICLEDEQNGVKSSWEMIMCEEDAKKVALRLAKITGIVFHDATVNNAPTVAVNCKDCDGYEAGYSAGLKDAEIPRDIFPMEIVAGKCPIEAGGDCPLRQQGEWIIVKDERLGDNVKCPFCGKELAGTDLNFCCKCGAKLRKGAEQ